MSVTADQYEHPSLQFFETLDIRSIKATLTLSIIGHGLAPSIACSVEGEVLNMGYVIAKEKVTSMFKVNPDLMANSLVLS